MKRRHVAAWVLLACFFSPPRAQGQSADLLAAHEYPSLRLGGFSDFNFFATDEQTPAATSGFKEGQFVLHFSSALSQRFSFFGEVTFGATATEFRTEVERGILKYVAHDALELSAGRYHTPINWWNTAFHHGQWLQTTVSRPEMTRFGGVFIPVHFVGLLAEGTLPTSGVNLLYSLGLGNGRGSNHARGGDAGDVNNNRAWLARLGLRPDRFYALQLGGAFYRDLVNLELAAPVRESIASAYWVWTRETPELLGEFALVRHEDSATGSSEDSQAWYVQGAYRLPLWRQRLKPYARFERLDIAMSDPVFENAVSSQELWTLGVRCDVADLVALKGEYRWLQTSPAEDVNALFLQASFAF